MSILTAAPGLSPSEVEQYITYPIETALNGLPDISEIRSISRTAVSAVTVVFKDQVNIWFARQLVSERMKIAAVSYTHLDVYKRQLLHLDVKRRPSSYCYLRGPGWNLEQPAS